MGPRNDAAAHLAKAAEFLAAADNSLDSGLPNAATSSAVSCGINAKDAVCLVLTGHTEKPSDHSEAVDELKRAGPAGAELAPTLARLLRFKSRSQYQADSVSDADAAKAVAWARRLHDAAAEIVRA